MITDVTTRFDDEIKKIFGANREILSFILNHERKGRCIQNLCAQIRAIETGRLSVRFDGNTYSQLIRDYAKIFSKVALQKVEEDHYSAARRAAEIQKANRLKDAELHIKDLEKETFRHADEFEKAEILKRREQEEIARVASERAEEIKSRS